MLLIFSPKDSPRLRYVCKLLLEELLGLGIRYTNDAAEARQHAAYTLNYSDLNIPGSFAIPAQGILTEEKTKDQELKPGNWQQLPVFFMEEGNYSLPFDLLGAAFFLVTRYEEWLPHIPDEHGRYPYTQSTAYQLGFLERPLVNEWLLELKKQLKTWQPNLQLGEPQFRFQATLDIDMVCNYRHKGWKRNLGGMLRDVSKLRGFAVIRRILTLLGIRKDEFDNFNWQQEVHSRYNIKPRYFFLMADHGPFNKNLKPLHPHQVYTIRKLAAGYPMGIHPGYDTYLDLLLIRKEKNRLETILGEPITHSRQHFLRAVFPHTFRNLLAAGIRNDYTLGYDGACGFRTSLAGPAPFFDLELNHNTELQLHPFQVMDVSLTDYLKFTPEEALRYTWKLIADTRRVGGTFTLLWHNESLSNQGRWKDWHKVYEELLKFARHGARGHDPAAETFRA